MGLNIYQDYEYIIRIMNTKACSVHMLYIQLVTKPYNMGIPAPGCSYDALCHSEHICDQVA